MRLASRSGLAACGLGAAAFAAVAWEALQARVHLGRHEELTGWTLLALMVLLGAFNLRKRLPMLPLGRASTWLSLHAIGGFVAMGVYFLHVGSLWPAGFYERMLAALFWLTSLSGGFGFAAQKIYPQRLTHVGYEIIFERVPAELARLRDEVEATIVACTEETASDTLARHYLDTLAWYFRKPRFAVSNLLGGEGGEHWLRHELAAVERYLAPAERRHLERMRELGLEKARVDRHHAGQALLKCWLLVHVPLSLAVTLVTAWHVLVVHIYAL